MYGTAVSRAAGAGVEVGENDHSGAGFGVALAWFRAGQVPFGHS